MVVNPFLALKNPKFSGRGVKSASRKQNMINVKTVCKRPHSSRPLPAPASPDLIAGININYAGRVTGPKLTGRPHLHFYPRHHVCKMQLPDIIASKILVLHCWAAAVLQDLIKSSLTDLGCCKLPLLVVAFLRYWRIVQTSTGTNYGGVLLRTTNNLRSFKWWLEFVWKQIIPILEDKLVCILLFSGVTMALL